MIRKEYCNMLTEILHDFQKSEILCDISIQLDDGTSIQAHSIILAAAMPRIRLEIVRVSKIPISKVLRLPGFNADEASQVLEYAYTGVVNGKPTLKVLSLFENLDMSEQDCLLRDRVKKRTNGMCKEKDKNQVSFECTPDEKRQKKERFVPRFFAKSPGWLVSDVISMAGNLEMVLTGTQDTANGKDIVKRCVSKNCDVENLDHDALTIKNDLILEESPTQKVIDCSNNELEFESALPSVPPNAVPVMQDVADIDFKDVEASSFCSHVCLLCFQSFSIHIDLYLHMNKHLINNESIFPTDGSHPFVCGICDVSFVGATEMDNHVEMMCKLELAQNPRLNEYLHSVVDAKNECDIDHLLTLLKLESASNEINFNFLKKDEIFTDNIWKGSNSCNKSNFYSPVMETNVEIIVLNNEGKMDEDEQITNEDEQITDMETSKLKWEGKILKSILKNKEKPNEQAKQSSNATEVFNSSTSVELDVYANADQNEIENESADEIPKFSRSKQIGVTSPAVKVPKPAVLKNQVKLIEGATYDCTICGRTFPDRRRFLSHWRGHTEGKPHKCSFCGDNFRFIYHLVRHSRVYHNQTVCKLCGLPDCKCETRKQDKSEEFKPVSVNNVESKAGFNRPNKSISKRKPLLHCSQCAKTFKYRYYLVLHERLHNNERPYMCEECGKSFRTTGQLSTHQNLHAAKPYSCDVCGMVFKNGNRLEEHVRIHTGDRPICCNFCDKSFATRNGLLLHLKKHQGTEYQCDICGNRFASKAYMLTHMEKHGGERKRSFKCDDCGAAFYEKIVLQQHKKIHAEVRDRPFGCWVCKKAFFRKNDLVLHNRLHTGEKPYDCRMCGKSFRVKSQYNRHIQIHSKRKSDAMVTVATDNTEVTFEEEVVLDVSYV